MTIKVIITEIKDEGLKVVVDQTPEETEALLADPRGEVRVGERGLKANLLVQMVQDTILVRGKLAVSLSLMCGRCMAPMPTTVQTELDLALFPKPEVFAEDAELESEDLDIAYYEGLDFDLEPWIREAIFLEVPTYPGCEPEAAEACPSYQEFMRAQEAPAPPARTNEVDPRWNALRAIKARMAEGGDKDKN